MNRGFLVGLVATLAAGALMALFRLGLDVFTVPEVLAEGAIFLVPLDIFSAVVEALGDWAKRLLVVGLAVVLLAIGGGGGALWGWLPGRWP